MRRGWSELSFLGALTAAMAAAALPSYALGTLAPVITADFGLSKLRLGSLTSGLFVVGAALSVPAGRLADMVGGRTLMRAGFLIVSLTLGALAIAPAYWWLLVSVGFAGFTLAAANPSTNRLLADHIDSTRQGVATGIKQSGVQFGAFFAGTALPPISVAWGWRWAMGACLVVPVAGLILTRVSVPGDTRPSVSSRLSSHGLPWATTGWLAVYAFLMGSGVAVIAAYLPLFAHDRLGLSLTGAGLVGATVATVAIAARIMWGHLSDRFSSLSLVLLLIATLSAVFASLIWLAEDVASPLIWFGAVGIGATAAAWNSVGMLAVVRGGGGAGLASGLVLLGFYSGFILAPLGFGYSVDATSAYDVGWGSVAVSYLGAAAIAARRFLRDRAAARRVAPRRVSGVS